MSAIIIRPTAAEAYDLIYPEHLAMLSEMDREAIHRAMNNSERLWIGKDSHDILAMWGLIAPTLLSDTAYLWLFTTKHFATHRLMFLRRSRQGIADMLRLYPTIVGHCKLSAAQSRQWLTWLGADFGAAQGDHIPFTFKASQ